MFTVCFAVYASLVSVTPVQSVCVPMYKPDVQRVTEACVALDKDPLTTCEVRRAGAMKVFVTVRQLEVS